MFFKLTLTEYLNEPEWSLERFKVVDDFYRCEVTGSDPDEVVNHIKGVILCAVGQRLTLPDEVNIKFDIEKYHEGSPVLD
jgi:hypothetical protein